MNPSLHFPWGSGDTRVVLPDSLTFTARRRPPCLQYSYAIFRTQANILACGWGVDTMQTFPELWVVLVTEFFGSLFQLVFQASIVTTIRIYDRSGAEYLQRMEMLRVRAAAGGGLSWLLTPLPCRGRLQGRRLCQLRCPRNRLVRPTPPGLLCQAPPAEQHPRPRPGSEHCPPPQPADDAGGRSAAGHDAKHAGGWRWVGQ